MKSKIKWVRNSRIKKRYPNICSSNILDKESDAKDDETVVSMTNVTKNNPIVNIRFSRKPERKENKIHSNGRWVTKSWTDHPNMIITVNTEENYIQLNRTKLKPSELKDLVEVVEIISLDI